MQYVELFGPPGVGKSTVFKKLQEYQYPTMIKRVIDKKPQSDLNLDLSHFLDFSLSLYEGLDDYRVPLRKKALQNSISRINTIKNDPSSKVVILDDALLQRGLSLASSGGRVNSIKDFYRKCPLPKAVVVFSALERTIIERNKNRISEGKPDLSRDVGKSYSAMMIGIEELTLRGCYVFLVNANGTLSETINISFSTVEKALSC